MTFDGASDEAEFQRGGEKFQRKVRERILSLSRLMSRWRTCLPPTTGLNLKPKVFPRASSLMAERMFRFCSVLLLSLSDASHVATLPLMSGSHS